MEMDFAKKGSIDLEELNERMRREVLKAIEPYGVRPVTDLAAMTDHERTKWLFWNLHENLD